MRKMIAAAPAKLPGNPYIELLYRTVRSHGWEISGGNTRSILLNRPSIFHVHWPEWNLKAKTQFRIAAFFTKIRVMKLSGIQIVWTVHNISPHEVAIDQNSQRKFYETLISLLDGCVFLSDYSREVALECYPSLADVHYSVIPHGDYRSVIPEHPDRVDARRKIGVPENAFVFCSLGAIKEYKNLPHLIDIFSGNPQKDTWLLLAGAVSEHSLGKRILELVKRNDRIVYLPGFITDRDMAGMTAASDVVVLPYKNILNSGSALYALSMNRTILVPSKGSLIELNRSLPEWVCLYEEDLDKFDMERSRWQSVLNIGKSCDLSEYDWSIIGARMVDFYGELLDGPCK